MSNGLSINSNVAALSIQSRLLKSQSALGNVYNKLASGMRVNSAKDDAAGYANIQRMTSQIRGLEQAKRNSQDALGMMNIAGGGLEEVTDALQRIKELASDAANGTRSQADRSSINLEVQQLIEQIDTIADTTKFGNTNLLNGTLGNVTIQTGANAGESIDVAGVDARSQSLGDLAMKLTGGNLGKAVAGLDNGLLKQDLTINDEVVSLGNDNMGVDEIVRKINAISGKNGVSASAETEAKITMADFIGDGTDADATFKINGQAINYTIAAAESVDDIKAKITDAINNNQNAATRGVQASFDGDDLVLSNESGKNISFGEANIKDTSGASLFTTDINVAVGSSTAVTISATTSDSVTAVGGLSLSSADPLRSDITVTSSVTAAAGALINTTDRTTMRSIEGMDVTTAANAKDLMTIVDGALEKITAHQARLGSISNRFESVVNNLATQSTNVQGARSRIQDVDVAAESTKLARLSILQQSATSMLAQANQIPAAALGLLR